MESQATKVRIIELWPKESECVLCGSLGISSLWLPMFEGKVVDDDSGEWAGMPVCPTCHKKHKK